MGKFKNVEEASAPDTLATHQVATIVLPTDGGKVLRIRKGMRPEAKHLDLYGTRAEAGAARRARRVVPSALGPITAPDKSIRRVRSARGFASRCGRLRLSGFMVIDRDDRDFGN